MSARVVRIFDRRRIAVNLGADDGLQVKDTLLIYTPNDDIVDPESGESLGAYRRLKAKVYVSEVFEKFCVAVPPNRREEVPIPGRQSVEFGPGISGMFGPKTETKWVPGQLNVDQGDIEPLPTGASIQVGDVVEREPTAEVETPSDVGEASAE